jgi:alkylhydroperoxidase/carboxymuconolactone decarboxylase family protein YurZ
MDEQYERGMAVRRAVLGDEYVDRVMANATPLAVPFQQFVTRWAWGEAWIDTTLDRKVRSLVTVATVATLGQLNEVKLHSLGALRNGCSPEEIASVIKNVAVYGGVARGAAAMTVLAEAMAEQPPRVADAQAAQSAHVASEGSQ